MVHKLFLRAIQFR